MIVLVIIIGIITGYIGRYVAKEKNRSATEGFLFGFLLSFIGIIIVALLPTKDEIAKTEEQKEKPKYATNDGEFSPLMFFGIIAGLIFIIIILDAIF